MTGLVDWAVARSRMMLVLAALALGAGVVAYFLLPREGSPNIDIPILYVSVGVPGASPDDVERLALLPLETELRGIEGLKQMTTYATQGHAGVLLEFNFGFDKSATTADTRDRVSRAQSKLPATAKEPRVVEVNLSKLPIMVVSLAGSAPERTLLRVARDLKRDIEGLSQVLQVSLTGHRQEMIELIVDPLRLEAYNVTAGQLIALVSANNSLVPAGELRSETGAYSVSVPGSIETVEDLTSLPVIVDGARVATLGDLAEVRLTFQDRDGYARYNGEQTIALQVSKRLGENIMDTAAVVHAAINAATAEWPASLSDSVSVEVSLEEAPIVAGMVSQLEGSVLTAVLLVMIVVLAALGLRSAVLVGFAVPMSFMIAFAMLAAFGMSINNMVMFGMILAVGMLVDGAIVVAEYAERRLARGDRADVAYASAAKRMFWPIVSSTATTLCAFLPMLLWPGMPGQFMRYLPLTLIFTLSASLIVALLFLPVAGATIGAMTARFGVLFRRPRGAAATVAGAEIPGRAPDDDALHRRRLPLVSPVIEWVALRPYGPFVALFLALVGLGATGVAFVSGERETEFFVQTEPERAVAYVRARGNLTLEERNAMVREAETRLIGGVDADGRVWEPVDGLRSVFAFAGSGSVGSEGDDAPPDVIGQLQLELTNWRERFARAEPLKGRAVLDEVAARLSQLPGYYAQVSEVAEGPQAEKAIELLLVARDAASLDRAADAVLAELTAIEHIIDIDDTRSLPGIEWRIEVDRWLAGRFGADIANIGAMVQMVTRGVTLDTATPDGMTEEVDVVVRYPDAFRSLDSLDALSLRTNVGVTPLSSFVTRDAAPEVSTIQRRDGMPMVLVRADVQSVEGDETANANNRIALLTERLTAISGADGPLAGVEWRFTGDAEEQEESGAFLGVAFLAALGLMFVILLAQFNSLYNSVLVLSAVIMSVGGVLLGMIVTGQSFSIIMTGTGIVALAGIVVNNNIVLIDTYQEYAARMPKLDAIVRTVEDRMRPVLLTTITTVAGLLPMAMAVSIDFGGRSISAGAPTAMWWVQLATAVVSGLLFSTVLTLMVTPAALALRAWLEIWLFKAPRSRLRPNSGSAALATPAE